MGINLKSMASEWTELQNPGRQGVGSTELDCGAVGDKRPSSPPAKQPPSLELGESGNILAETRVNVQNVRRICRRGAGLNVDYYASFYRRADADSIFQLLESQLQSYFASTCSSPQSVKLGGRVVAIPRRQTAFGDRGLTYSFSGVTVRANPWTPLVSSLKDHVEKAIGEKFNFVLVNRYKDGLDHIGEHRDDERELQRGAPIASLSFGQARDFILRHKDARGGRNKGGIGGGGRKKGGIGGGGRNKGGIGGIGGGGRNKGGGGAEPVKIELGHGSLLVLRHPTNSTWYHSLPVRRRALHPRVNLTFRRMTEPRQPCKK